MPRFDTRLVLAVTAFALVALAAACSQAGLLRIAGVAPNILLVVLVVVSFFSDNILFYLLIVFFAILMGRATPLVFDPFATVTAVLAVVVFWLQRHLVWPGFIGTAITVSVTTLLTYVIIAPTMLWQHPGLVASEVVYNVGVGIVLFELLYRFFGRSMRSIR